MIQVKICGLTRKEDAEKAIEFGANAVGFIFSKMSKRFISEDRRQWIEKISGAQKVGVFVNQKIEEIRSVFSERKLDIIQLHGDENSDFINQLKLPVWKVVSIQDAIQNNFPKSEWIEKYLIDTVHEGQSGGTGKSFDWSLISEIKIEKPFIVAGGITPENVTRLLQNKVVNFIDVNSGVEDSPGIKNYKKMKILFEAVRSIK